MQTSSVVWKYARVSSSEVIKPFWFSSTLNSIPLPLYLLRTVIWVLHTCLFFLLLPSWDYFSRDVISQYENYTVNDRHGTSIMSGSSQGHVLPKAWGRSQELRMSSTDSALNSRAQICRVGTQQAESGAGSKVHWLSQIRQVGNQVQGPNRESSQKQKESRSETTDSTVVTQESAQEPSSLMMHIWGPPRWQHRRRGWKQGHLCCSSNEDWSLGVELK